MNTFEEESPYAPTFGTEEVIKANLQGLAAEVYNTREIWMAEGQNVPGHDLLKAWFSSPTNDMSPALKVEAGAWISYIQTQNEFLEGKQTREEAEDIPGDHIAKGRELNVQDSPRDNLGISYSRGRKGKKVDKKSIEKLHPSWQESVTESATDNGKKPKNGDSTTMDAEGKQFFDHSAGAAYGSTPVVSTAHPPVANLMEGENTAGGIVVTTPPYGNMYPGAFGASEFMPSFRQPAQGGLASTMPLVQSMRALTVTQPSRIAVFTPKLDFNIQSIQEAGTCPIPGTNMTMSIPLYENIRVFSQQEQEHVFRLYCTKMENSNALAHQTVIDARLLSGASLGFANLMASFESVFMEFTPPTNHRAAALLQLRLNGNRLTQQVRDLVYDYQNLSNSFNDAAGQLMESQGHIQMLLDMHNQSKPMQP